MIAGKCKTAVCILPHRHATTANAYQAIVYPNTVAIASAIRASDGATQQNERTHAGSG